MKLNPGQAYRSVKHGHVIFVGPGKNGAIVQHDNGQIFEVLPRELSPWVGDVWLVYEVESGKVIGLVRTQEQATQRAAAPGVLVLPYKQA